MRYFLAFVVLLVCCVSYAQQQTSGQLENRDDNSWEQYLTELYGSDYEAEESLEDAYEHLTDLALQPLDINNVEAADLMQIPGLDVNQINDIIAYRQKYGNFRSIDELSMISSIDNAQRLFLSYFLKVYDTTKVKWYSREGFKTQLRHIDNEITLTAQIPTYYRAGDINAPEKTYLGNNRYAGRYLGDPVKHSLRYSLDIGNNISFNLTGAKIAGEPFGGPNNRYGYDSYAFNLSIRQLGIFREIIIGQFRGQFGMGLILNNNFYMGKQGMLASMGRRASVFTPHSSTSDSKHFQGIAATVDITRHLQLSAFFSYRYIDATLNADSTISTILTTGYHRTTTEMDKKNNASQLTTGMHIGYEQRQWGIGVNAIFSHADQDINPVYSKADTISRSRLYRIYNASGNNLWNVSIDYRYRYRDLAFCGETATGGAFSPLSTIALERAKKGNGSAASIATINSLTWRSPWGVTFMALQRYYSYQYSASYGRSFGENSQVQNESGFYFGVQWQPRRNLTIDAYSDISYFPWLKYLVSNSSYCWDNSLMATLNTGNWAWSVRYRVKMKQKDMATSINSATKELCNRVDQRLRLLAQLSNNHWTSRTQLEGCLLNFDSSSKGFIVSEGLGYKIDKKFAVNGTTAYFNTEDYDSRLYTWEQSVRYAFGSTYYYGKGMHLAFLAKYQPFRWLIASAKVSYTRYFDRNEIGTAERMIFSNHYTDLDFQLIFKL